ncbi:hypothetical protein [Nocardia brasiliensis]|uniref:Integrase family protein n=1 Tax=Nocardia brasiliensis (strain ATCC 700358 / HUJEG-1) TaxID=1133849 RepID=K0F1A4_NOCB7|nr:hypothetical protein [Nocardia brasiliensis]AFU02895.1 integrase family protein [Nocardia brasiliensis ATCC 700358]
MAIAILKDYGNVNLDTAMRGREDKTTVDAYKLAWRLRVVPTLGHLMRRVQRTAPE